MSDVEVVVVSVLGTSTMGFSWGRSMGCVRFGEVCADSGKGAGVGGTSFELELEGNGGKKSGTYSGALQLDVRGRFRDGDGGMLEEMGERTRGGEPCLRFSGESTSMPSSSTPLTPSSSSPSSSSEA